jgi:hypothetical protein
MSAGPMFALEEIRAEFEVFFERESTKKLEKVLHPVNMWHAIWVAKWGAKKRPPGEVKGSVTKMWLGGRRATQVGVVRMRNRAARVSQRNRVA